MKPLSQRDNRWKYIKLGWSNDTNIGSHGCLITCLSMLWDTTPDKVNEWLKNNNGYVNLNLVNWEKVPGFKWRGWSYNNAEVLETIDKYGSCIVEVDFNTNPEDGSHFVVFTGNKKLNDPWDGKEKPTSSFSTFYGYATIDPSKNPLKGEQMPDEDLTTDANNWKELRKRSLDWNLEEILGYELIESVEDCEKVFNMAKNIKTDSNNWKAICKVYQVESVEALDKMITDLKNSTPCEKLLKEKDSEYVKRIEDLDDTHEEQVRVLTEQIAKPVIDPCKLTKWELFLLYFGKKPEEYEQNKKKTGENGVVEK